jgi:hypothetical protein
MDKIKATAAMAFGGLLFVCYMWGTLIVPLFIICVILSFFDVVTMSSIHKMFWYGIAAPGAVAAVSFLVLAATGALSSKK